MVGLLQRNFAKVGLVALLVAFLVGSTIVTQPATKAYAGSNGQQIDFSCPTMSYAVVKGYNHAGNYVQWEGPAQGTTSLKSIFTRGWYWVGYVRVHWWNPVYGRWYSNDIYVPKQQNGDITYGWCVY